MIYLQLFLAFFKIGIIGFGGGMAIVSLIQNEVERYGWMSSTEYLDILAISQITPGPIGINCATYVGYTASGNVLGSLVATFSIILPSLIIMLILSALYERISRRWSSSKGYQWTMVVIRALVILLIAQAAIRLVKPEAFIDAWSWILFSIVFVFTLLPQFIKIDIPASTPPAENTPQMDHIIRRKRRQKKALNFITHPITLILFCGLSGFLLYGCGIVKSQEEKQVDAVMKTLSTREKVAQLVMISTTSYGDSAYQARVTSFVEEDGVGGLILMHDSLTRCRAYLNDLQARAKTPLIVAIDGEWGPAMRFAEFPFFPRQMQLGALPSDSLIYEMGLAVGRQCREAGIQINFAPVVDINNNPGNVAIDTRSFGETRELVARNGSAYMRGMQDAGIFACAKHFPGHGDTDVDSHKALPTLPFSRERLDSLELYPFRRLIKDGVSLVMLGHLNVPALDTAVSSVSYPIVTQLLKKDLGFKGVVITDALVMKGIADGHEPDEVMEMAYAAGVDILLMSARPKQGIDRITKAIEDGKYSMKDLDKRVRKVLMLKAKSGLLDGVLDNAHSSLITHHSSLDIDTTGLVSRIRLPQDSILIEEICDQSMTLVQNQGHLLPLSDTTANHSVATSRIAYLGFGTQWQPLRRFYGELEGLSGYGGGSGILPDRTTTFGQALSKELPIDYYSVASAPLAGGADTTEADARKRAEALQNTLQQLARYEYVIIGIHDPGERPHRYLIADSLQQAILKDWAEHRSVTLSGDSKQQGDFAYNQKVVCVFFGNPYALNDYPWLTSFSSLVIAYADTKPNERAAASLLLGHIRPQGALPVTSGALPAGTGLKEF